MQKKQHKVSICHSACRVVQDFYEKCCILMPDCGGVYFRQRSANSHGVLRPLFPALNALCGGGAKPLQTTPENCIAVSFPALPLQTISKVDFRTFANLSLAF
jgi:hypothetical protein